MSKEEKIKEISEKVVPIFKKYGIARAGVFGSYARGDNRPDSDVDILVKRGDQILSLIDFVGMKHELEDTLNKKVDLVSEAAVVPYFRESIFKDLTPIYG